MMTAISVPVHPCTVFVQRLAVQLRVRIPRWRKLIYDACQSVEEPFPMDNTFARRHAPGLAGRTAGHGA
jgi:hypothetical protein